MDWLAVDQLSQVLFRQWPHCFLAQMGCCWSIPIVPMRVDERTFVEERFGCDVIVLTLRDLVKQIVPHDHDHH